ncbi:Lrp/AsnC family transcriptional regulator [Cognatiyoonia sp.]|uniref:Lrp/AsnC family transcriptional regulator n=1 Tax=Cognatiyoonia sp. TaxID=2211652 RepID=UPI003F69C999
MLDELDMSLVRMLRRNARASLSELAADLGVQRNTVRARMAKLVEAGDIVGFTVETKADISDYPVRGLMMLEIAGRQSEKVAAALLKRPEVQAVHSTNGKWDYIAEIGAETLEAFDAALTAIRRTEAIGRTETSILLSTRR